MSRKRLFCAGMVFLILLLAVFKYLGFIESNVQWLLGLVGIPVDFSVKSILFPLGISFYTFQALSYLIDVYWGEEEPERSLPDFTLYMLLFMKFLSGPIERAGDFLPQAKAGKAFDYESVTYGMKLMCIGLMKKMIIADRLAPYLNDILGSVQSTSGVQLLLAGLLYHSCQQALLGAMGYYLRLDCHVRVVGIVAWRWMEFRDLRFDTRFDYQLRDACCGLPG